jgi:ferritin
MTFSERSRQAMNQQLMREIEASYTYLSMAEYCEAVGFHGFGSWLEHQSGEEWEHAMKFRKFLQDRGERVQYEAIPEPEAHFSSLLEVFERALENEHSVTRSINDLYALAEQEKDFASQAFLNWFVTEQVEEEKNVSAIVDWLRRLGDSTEGLYLLDRQLGGSLEAGTGGETASPSETTPH